MGLPTWCRKELRKRYPAAFQYDSPQYQMITIDFMQFLKGSLPDSVIRLRDLKRFFYSKITPHFKSQAGCQVLIICVDRGSPPVKQLVVHEERYEIRCKKCREKPSLPKGKTADASYFHEECEKGCIHKQIMWAEEGPYIVQRQYDEAPVKRERIDYGPIMASMQNQEEEEDEEQQVHFPPPASDWEQANTNYILDEDRILPDWLRFSADSRNLRREIYPLLMNWVLEYQFERPGLMILTHGLPAKTQLVPTPMKQGFHVDNDFSKRYMMIPWRACDLPIQQDMYDFSRVYMMKSLPPSAQYPNGYILQEEVVEMRNHILEADNAVFFYSRFFPEFKQAMAYINDGDAISIGLLRTMEDFTGTPEPVKEQWLALPYKDEESSALFVASGRDAPRIEYINLTLLYQKIESSAQFIKAGVQSPVVTLIFLLIIADSDFFRKEFCFGIGATTKWNEDDEKRKNQTLGFWDTFFQQLEKFSHMIQYYPITKSLTEKRLVVMDEDLFAEYTSICYMNKYSKAVEKKTKRSATEDDVRIHCSKLKDTRKHFPTQQRMKRWARQIQWNLNYWANAFRDIDIDPFEQHLGMPYWGYDRERGLVDDVSPKQKGLDEVHKRHLQRRIKKTEELPVIPEKRRKMALESIRGK